MANVKVAEVQPAEKSCKPKAILIRVFTTKSHVKRVKGASRGKTARNNAENREIKNIFEYMKISAVTFKQQQHQRGQR